MTKQTFFQGTLILIGAGLVTKVMGFANRIFLSRIIGAEGMGLYQMAVPTLYLIITLTQFGLPIAISKLVAEADASNDKAKIKSILKISLLFVAFLSIIFTSAMVIAAPYISTHLLTDRRVYLSLLAISPIVPAVAVSSILRGYFQGIQNMTPPAIAQIAEQFIRIITVLFLASYFLPRGIEYASAGAMIGIVLGELTGMCFLVFQFRKAKWNRFWDSSKLRQQMKGNYETWKGLFRIAIPVTSGRLIGSLTFWIEPVIVVQSLALAGFSTSTSTGYYGQLQGMAIPLLTFPTFFTYSLGVSLVPAVAEAFAMKNWRLINRRIYQSLRIALVIGAPFTVLMYIFAEPLCQLIYHSSDVGQIMKLMAPFFLLLYFQGPLSSALQGLDYAQVAMKNSIYGAVLKTAAIFLLASQPVIGMKGVTISISIGIMIVTLLHFFSLVKITSFTIELREFIKVGLAMVIMGYSGLWIFSYVKERLDLASSLLSASILSMGIYLIILFWSKVLGKQDIQRIPWIGKLISPFFPLR